MNGSISSAGGGGPRRSPGLRGLCESCTARDAAPVASVLGEYGLKRGLTRSDPSQSEKVTLNVLNLEPSAGAAGRVGVPMPDGPPPPALRWCRGRWRRRCSGGAGAPEEAVPRTEEGCVVCGCSAEWDRDRERVCWCDSCWVSGCQPGVCTGHGGRDTTGPAKLSSATAAGAGNSRTAAPSPLRTETDLQPDSSHVTKAHVEELSAKFLEKISVKKLLNTQQTVVDPVDHPRPSAAGALCCRAACCRPLCCCREGTRTEVPSEEASGPTAILQSLSLDHASPLVFKEMRRLRVASANETNRAIRTDARILQRDGREDPPSGSDAFGDSYFRRAYEVFVLKNFCIFRGWEIRPLEIASSYLQECCCKR